MIGLAEAQWDVGGEVRIICGQASPANALHPPRVPVQRGRTLPFPHALPGYELRNLLIKGALWADVLHVHGLWTGIGSAGMAQGIRKSGAVVLSPRGMLDYGNVRNRWWLKRAYLACWGGSLLEKLAGLHFLDHSEYEDSRWYRPVERPERLILPNGIDLRKIDRVLDGAVHTLKDGERESGKNPIHLVYMGRLHPIKGLELQLEVVRELQEGGRRVMLHWIGPDDGEWVGLRNYAADLGVADSLVWHGAIYGDERLPLLRQADAVLLTSHYDCNSNAAAETLGVGGLLVGTDTCHLDRAKLAGGALVVPRKTRAVTEALESVLDDPARQRQIRKAARQFARDTLDLRQTAQTMLNFYEELLQRRAR